MSNKAITDGTPYRKYCPCFCEENVWHLVQESKFEACERIVVLISNTDQTCLFWQQRAGLDEDMPVLWDYHVVLFVRDGTWVVYDLDTNLPLSIAVETYLRQSFLGSEMIPESFRPRFVLFDGDAYVKDFSSDRSHMLDAEGQWLVPPPEWPAIERERGRGFLDFVQLQMLSSDHLSLNELLAYLARNP